jgi:hypothetical protein
VLNPEAYERIEVAVNDVIPVARLLAAARAQPAAAGNRRRETARRRARRPATVWPRQVSD